MRILYGVQATGNGHVTRARAMARAFEKTDIEVNYLFSGRPVEKMFSMEPFGEYIHHRGLTLFTKNGCLDYLKTLQKNNVFELLNSIFSLNVSAFDLIITDFEPVSAWAARIHNIPCLGISHQYAFNYDIPKAGTNIVSSLVMRALAPADRYLGFHWYHYDSPILPPLIEREESIPSSIENKIVVYLPFENINNICNLLMPIEDYQFYIYHDITAAEDNGHLHLRSFDNVGFHHDLLSSNGVISNAGFGLGSEAIQYGKKLLVIPLKGQMEQQSNALALQQLGKGIVMSGLDLEILKKWLAKESPKPVIYPNVADSIVSWIGSGFNMDIDELAKNQWRLVC